MKRVALLFVLTLPSAVFPQERPKALREVTVSARRSLKDIGTQQTRLDSLALKENVALSMADILAYNSSIFVKNHGRATLSTVSVRGTSPSHTQVSWNGMAINSPMNGMTDFSTIPSFFIDRAAVVYGASSVSESGGGLGGAVRMETAPEFDREWSLQYVQGVGSFRTFDEFAKISYSTDRWQLTTRASCSTSPNDYKYVNHDKKVNIYDENHNIINQYNPTERNRSGAYADIHVMQEAYFNTLRGDRFGLAAWFSSLNRHLPMLSTDYGNESEFLNLQRERTLRVVADWTHTRDHWQLKAKAGYEYSLQRYLYEREVAEGKKVTMSRTRSSCNSLFGRVDAEFLPSAKWMFTLSLNARQHFVRSTDKEITLQNNNRTFIGYDKGRIELSAAASAKWQPTERLGLSATLRQEMAGTRWSPVIPAVFADFLLIPGCNLTLKTSASRNYRTPSLNDLFFMPGGNPDLKDEKGVTYDFGTDFNMPVGSKLTVGAGVTWFESKINNWILWLPTPKGYFSPKNVKQVHSYGIETKADLLYCSSPHWILDLSGSVSWTPSINVGRKISDADLSVGKQLPYTPRLSASVVGRLSWRSWSFTYKWNHYSERFTMSSNSQSLTGHLPPYFMSNVSLEKKFTFRPLDMQIKLAVNNLFNEDYLSVLSHPMPGINYEIFLIFTPKLQRH